MLPYLVVEDLLGLVYLKMLFVCCFPSDIYIRYGDHYLQVYIACQDITLSG